MERPMLAFAISRAPAAMTSKAWLAGLKFYEGAARSYHT